MRGFQALCSTCDADLLRAARALLGWSLMEAGARAGVSISMVLTAEGKRVRSSSTRSDNFIKLRRTYEEAGVRFIDEPSTGRGIRIESR